MTEHRILKLQDLNVGDRFRFVDDDEIQTLDCVDDDKFYRCVENSGRANWHIGSWPVERIKE
jgi:hypothetical protein